MRFIGCVAAGLIAFTTTAEAARQTTTEFASLQSTIDWINNYRAEQPISVAPLAIRALSMHGGFREPEAAGVYIGFIAGLIGTNERNARSLIDRMLPVRSEDEWAIVRGIAYSGHPQWRQLLSEVSPRLPTRAAMIQQYLDGTLPVLSSLTIKPSPTSWQRMKEALSAGWLTAKKDDSKKQNLEPTQMLLDVLWGYYLASGSYAPIMTIVDLLPWSKDRDDTERLTIGSMAKYTLAMNASRDPQLLVVLKHLRKSKISNDVAAPLDEVIAAADTADAGKLRKNALASIEELKIKGPNYKRDMSTWNKIGQGALAVGCVAAAATGHIEFGLPCVIGGGASNAVAYYMNDR